MKYGPAIAATPPHSSEESMQNVVPLATQRHAALAHANELRIERSQSKRRLKVGQESVAEAMERPCWQSATVLELLGYVCIGQNVGKDPRLVNPHPLGATARRLAAACDVSHFTLVRSLSPARRREVAYVVESYALSATGAVEPAASASAAS